MNKVIGAFLGASLILVSLVRPSQAQEGQGPAAPGIKPKSESTALIVSLAGTLVPIGVAAIGECSEEGASALAGVSLLGVTLGPSLGYFYAGLGGRGLTGLMTRLAGLVAMVGAIAVAWDDGSPALAFSLAIGGGAVVLGSTIYDLTTVKRAVCKRNDRVRGASLNVAPVLAPRSKTVGLILQLGF